LLERIALTLQLFYLPAMGKIADVAKRDFDKIDVAHMKYFSNIVPKRRTGSISRSGKQIFPENMAIRFHPREVW
jgi:hypothetical protein